MGLITCPDCSHNISSEAPACPYCGKPMFQPPTQVAQRTAAERKRKSGTAMIIAVCIVGFGIWLLYKLPTETAFLAFMWLIIIPECRNHSAVHLRRSQCHTEQKEVTTMPIQSFRIERVRIGNLEAPLAFTVSAVLRPLGPPLRDGSEDPAKTFDEVTLTFDNSSPNADFLRAIRESFDRKATRDLFLIGPDAQPIIATIQGISLPGAAHLVVRVAPERS